MALGDDATVPKILLLSDNKWVAKGVNYSIVYTIDSVSSHQTSPHSHRHTDQRKAYVPVFMRLMTEYPLKLSMNHKVDGTTAGSVRDLSQ